MATNKPKSSTAAILSAAQLRTAKKLPIGNDFVLVNIGHSIEAKVRPGDKAEVLVGKAAAALKSPGIARGAVFRGAKPQKVFAYSAFSGDSSMLVRESSDGTRLVGKIGANGKFRPSRKAA